MQTLSEFLEDLKREWVQKFADSVSVTVEWYMDEHCEIEGCNAYIFVMTPNGRGGRETLKFLAAYIDEDIVEFVVSPGY